MGIIISGSYVTTEDQLMPRPDLAGVEAQLRHLADALAAFQRESPSLETGDSAPPFPAVAVSGLRDVVGQVLSALEGRLGDGEGLQVLVAGVRRGPAGHTTTWYEAFSDKDVPKILAHPGLARSLELLANAERLRLLSALVSGAFGSAEAMNRSGLSQGQFYHHLRALEAAGMVRKATRDQYEPTVHGTSALFTLLAAADYITRQTVFREEDSG
jgi:DNA-binding transcriptional ArsR family regulator